MSDTVGRSGRRTPAKHAFLNAVLGREIGAAQYTAPKMRTPYRRHWFVDCTAGDGIAYHDEGEWFRSCSPGILAHHARWSRCPVPVHVVLIERATETYDKLLVGLDANLPALGYVPRRDGWAHAQMPVTIEAHNSDARDFEFTFQRGDFVFANNDPNKVHDWALPHSFATNGFRDVVVRSFNTMGCNASGIKRLPFEGGREAWFSYVDAVLGATGPSQDLLLFAIDRDADQWAYLLVTPTKWVGRDTEEARRVYGRYGMTVTARSARNDRDGFDDLVECLFLTAKERRAKDAQGEGLLW